MSVHIGDYRKDTGHLRAAGHGGYWLLMMHYWATGGLPDDDRQLANIACMTPKEWRDWGPILRAFFKPGMKHKRIDAELAAAEANYRKRAAAGHKGGKAKAMLHPADSNATDGNLAMLKHPLFEERKKDGEEAPKLDPEADLFRRGKEVLGESAGGLIAKLFKAKDRSVAKARAVIETASTKQNPKEYVAAVLRTAESPEKPDFRNAV